MRLRRRAEALNPVTDMRRGLTLAILSLGLLLPGFAAGQTRERVKVTNIRLGLPVGPYSSELSRRGMFKVGQWAPVYLDLECVRDVDERLVIVVETKDADELSTEGSIEIGSMRKDDRLTAAELGRVAYLKPGQTYSAVTVKVKGAESGKTYGENAERSHNGMEGAPFLVLGIGTNLNGMRFPATNQRGDDFPSRALRGGWVETCQLTDVGLMPDKWFGYEAVDLMVIGTGADRTFWETLAAPAHEKRRKAIVEWVRRGGRAVMSVGTNPDLLDAFKELKDMLPATIPPGGKRTTTRQTFFWAGVTGNATGLLSYLPEAEFAVTTLAPKADRPTRAILSGDEAGRVPLAVQSPYGLGRITVFGLDLDRGPFSEWGGRGPFWENLVAQTAHPLPQASTPVEGSRFGRSDTNEDYSASLQGSLDYFEGVPVVSFGWVALFILIYIVLIGPVDYLFLKKVVKRLEWTWVTFPVIVITVSAGAYFAAYALKGKDLKINKVDVVDIDLIGNRIDGHAWFTLFSPRIQNYTIGVEPAGTGPEVDPAQPTWTPAQASDAARDTLLGWQSNVGGYGRGGGGSGSLFTKRYKYQSTTDPQDPNRELYATGLEGVPIQVWTTKAFSAQWTAAFDPVRPPIEADLRMTGDNGLIGTITSHLPVEQFTDIALLWRGKSITIRDLPIGVSKSVSFSAAQGGAEVTEASAWLDHDARWGGVRPPRKQTGNQYPYPESGTTSNPKFPLWPVLFSETLPASRNQVSNAGLRKLDQSWRIAPDRPEQAILVLRIATRETSAETATRDAASPSRLWLGELPTAGGPRPALQGTLKQETYVRVFIPVKPAKK
ncbi:MAG TPA: hypothetical protein VKE40_16160 [Gemmataceae bacterium]|nr:hypothetical protein [Gemmataceae bacterium]